ncbi:hypothetical protein [Niabella hirudinis]|uniref:hypothetical protein n=1 Tax=Niabella hirudinis TaxID=1285929 RepID=UPI003EB7A1D8
MRWQLNIKAVFFAGSLLLAVTGVAQEIPSRPNEGVRRTETRREQYDVYQKLKLTADQKNQLKILQKEGKEGFIAIRNDMALTDAAKKEKLQVLQRQQTKKRNAILTPEQQQIWKDESRGRSKQGPVKTDQRLMAADGRSDRNALPETLEKNAPKIALSAAQEQKMDALRTTFKEQARSIRRNPALSADEKKARVETLKKETRKKQKALLTTAQWQQWIKQGQNRNSISKQ